jgi:hypothetical protein
MSENTWGVLIVLLALIIFTVIALKYDDPLYALVFVWATAAIHYR